jgi:hypothetical protein
MKSLAGGTLIVRPLMGTKFPEFVCCPLVLDAY